MQLTLSAAQCRDYTSMSLTKAAALVYSSANSTISDSYMLLMVCYIKQLTTVTAPL
jgi:hypothetical protein